jgi:hypothetical protein
VRAVVPELFDPLVERGRGADAERLVASTFSLHMAQVAQFQEGVRVPRVSVVAIFVVGDSHALAGAPELVRFQIADAEALV